MDLRKAYLVTYNLIQCLGWTRLLTQLTKVLFFHGFDPRLALKTCSLSLKVFQTLAVLESVHSAIGLVRSPLVVTSLQLASRLLLTWLTVSVSSAQTSHGVILYMLCWSVTEVIRYSFYASNLFDRTPKILTWMRYSFFILLYPLGVAGELMTIFATLPQIKSEKILSLELPNASNISFSLLYFMCLFLMGYVPFFPKLYFYMLAQRKKMLGPKRD